MADVAWRGRVCLDAGLILYVGPGAAADSHAHHAVQLVWSDAGDVEAVIGGQRVQARALLIPAHAPHTLNAVGRRIALLLVESHSARGVALDRVAHDLSGETVSSRLAGLAFPTPEEDVSSCCDRILDALGVVNARTELSSVSRRAIAQIEHAIAGVPRVADVAATLRLSTTRLTHLFSREVGMPFRRFVLWTRIKVAVASVQAGNDLTAAAIAAGFSDAAHFSRTFRAMFGLSPSLVLSVAELTGSVWSATSP